MTRLRFTDGVEFDTSGPLRIESRPDGLYVVGHGFLCGVDSEEDGEQMIARLQTPPAPSQHRLWVEVGRWLYWVQHHRTSASKPVVPR
jgi:hypothetical protein